MRMVLRVSHRITKSAHAVRPFYLRQVTSAGTPEFTGREPRLTRHDHSVQVALPEPAIRYVQDIADGERKTAEVATS
jgi:hypothetical protein